MPTRTVSEAPEAVAGINGQGDRQGKRESLFLSATIRVEEGEAFSARVRNLSAGGMMIDVVAELTVGAPVCAEMRGIGEICGRIAWLSPGRAGVAFDEEVDPRLARTSSGGKVPAATFVPRPIPGRRPGLALR